MQYGVQATIDLADLDDIEDPKQLVYMIVDWRSVDEVEVEIDEDGEEQSRMRELWFPAALSPCVDGGGWHGPAATLFAPMHVFDSYKKALIHAIRVIRRLNKERIALERGLEDLTAEAAAVLEDD